MRWAKKAEERRFRVKERQAELNKAQFAGEEPKSQNSYLPTVIPYLPMRLSVKEPSSQSLQHQTYMDLLLEERLMQYQQKTVQFIKHYGIPTFAAPIDPDELDRLALIAELKRLQAEDG